MGTSSSKPGVHYSPLPMDQFPYQGPSIEYCLLDVPVRIKAKMSFNFAPGQTMTTSDVDSYYQYLADRYNEGFSLISFFRIPGTISGVGFRSVTYDFKGIFSRQMGYAGRRPFQLRIHKSMIHIHLLRSGVLFGAHTAADTNISHVYDLINQECMNGSRFLCMEWTGGQQSQGFSAAMHGVTPALGLDIFFDVPDQPIPSLYTMQAVSVPIQINYKFGFGPASVEVICDWMGTLALYLNQGWRLSDIFVASPADHARQRVALRSVNTIWFFEKETAKLHDNTPQYEGTVIEYYAKLKGGFGSVSCRLELGPVLSEMGGRGWSLVCTVDTPKIIGHGFSSVTKVMLLVFQRPILGRIPAQVQQFGEAGAMAPEVVGMQPTASAGPSGATYPASYGAAALPSYSEATKEDK